jgi:hypothetical protein
VLGATLAMRSGGGSP